MDGPGDIVFFVLFTGFCLFWLIAWTDEDQGGPPY
jgi:hypothetical protein